MKTTILTPQGSLMNGKISDNTESNKSPEALSYEKLTHEIEMMETQLLNDYSEFQSENNKRKGIAGEVELFD